MGLLAWVAGALGGLCMVIGITTAAGVVPIIGTEFTWMFWFVLSALLLLGCIAFAVGHGGAE